MDDSLFIHTQTKKESQISIPFEENKKGESKEYLSIRKATNPMRDFKQNKRKMEPVARAPSGAQATLRRPDDRRQGQILKE